MCNKLKYLGVVGLLLIVSQYIYALPLIPWSNPEGVERLQRSQHKVDFFKLANNFESQSNGIYCGPTTAVIVLNALRLTSGKVMVPKDYSVLNESERQYLPNSYDATYKRYTQRNFFSIRGKKLKDKMSVLGKPREDGKQDFGFQLRQYNELLKAHRLKTKMQIVDEKIDEKEIKKEIIANLSRANDYVIINYQRKALGQEGGGHISPLAAYDEKSDSFLILDVTPNKAPWVWVSAMDLIAAMRTFDTNENRGYILVEDTL